MKKMIFLTIILSIFLTSCSILNFSRENKNIAILKTNFGDITIKLKPEIAPKTVANFVSLAKGEKIWQHPVTGKTSNEPFYDGLSFHRVVSNFMIQGGCPVGNGTGGLGYTFEDETYYLGSVITGKITTDAVARQVREELIIPYLKNTKTPNPEIVELLKECQAKASGKPLMKYDVEHYMSITGNGPIYQKLEKNLKAKVEYGSVCMANSGYPNSNGSQFFIVTKQDGCPWLDGKHTVFGKVIKGMEVVHKIENLPVGKENKPLPDHKPLINKVIFK